MTKTIFSAVILLSGALLITPLARHEIDPRHSEINFVANARLISAHGHFDKWDAEVNLDPEKMENSNVKITIDAASINTKVAPRDAHLRSKDFLWVEQYPTITFVSKKVSGVREGHYKIIGDFSLRGVTKELTVPVEMVFYENNRGRFRGAFQLSRSEFGVSYNSAGNPIEDLVQVQFDINLVNKPTIENKPKAPAVTN